MSSINKEQKNLVHVVPLLVDGKEKAENLAQVGNVWKGLLSTTWLHRKCSSYAFTAKLYKIGRMCQQLESFWNDTARREMERRKWESRRGKAISQQLRRFLVFTFRFGWVKRSKASQTRGKHVLESTLGSVDLWKWSEKQECGKWMETKWK
jgi:hypothetical protein